MTNRLLCSCLAFAAALFAGPLQAEEPRIPGVVSLRADTPEECGDDAELVHRIEALLGRSLAGRSAEPLSVRLRVLGDPNRGYVAQISFAGARGNEQRSLEHPSCDKLIEASALVIALAIDPDAVHEVERAKAANEPPVPALPTPPLAATPTPVVRSEPEPKPEAKVEPAHSPLRGARLGLSATLGAGPLPDLGGGLQVALGFQRSSLRAELVGRYWMTRSQRVSVAPNTNAEFDLVTLGVRGCWLPIASDWAVAACAGVDVGDLRGTGIGLEAARSNHARYSDLAGSVRVAYPRWRVAPEAGFELAGALERPGFGVRDGEISRETYRPSAWGLVAFFGAAFEL